MPFANQKVFTTRPYLPPLEEFMPYLEKIWESRQLTNKGPFHDQFESELGEYLGVKHISLVTNGTIALILALKALNIKGEVITTPFSFAATSHVLLWNDLKPVFVDIEPEYLNIDPEKIETAITKNTMAILPVHVFGNPCNFKKIEHIAQEFKLRTIYDGCHAFGVNFNEESILNFGDLTVVSFHATKAFNTFEGGAIISKTGRLKEKIDKLKNYGFLNETTIDGFGINGKLNEFQAALGLLQLKYFYAQVIRRKEIVKQYKIGLKEIPGIFLIAGQTGLENSHSFLPVLVNKSEYGHNRDYLYNCQKNKNIYTRRYFFPLISDLPAYCHLPSASPNNLPVASRVSKEILCLPVYPDLEEDVINSIIEAIKSIAK
jgi:dTDP-4-amino-4,6-dideoxygalactose transaminase